ncbi:MAG: hypothetical protein LUE64_00555 [Candidatus Gastranaerophilales bacterium]|nr:hypothetical protein [Candidatus Gastranaerophilales bacterium]
MLNTNQISNTPQAVLPDDSDRASSLTGYNINNYVFGDKQPVKNPLPQNSNEQAPEKPKSKIYTSGLLGLISLAGLGALSAFSLKKCGKLESLSPKELFKKININA